MANENPKANDPKRFEEEQKRKGGAGDFANDPRRASDAGRKGGQHSGQQEQAGHPQRQQGEERHPAAPKNDQQR